MGNGIVTAPTIPDATDLTLAGMIVRNDIAPARTAMLRNFHSLAVPLIALWAGSLIPPAAAAEEFSWQVSGRYEDMDAASHVETSLSSLRATWYPTAVDDQAGPYELAPFLNRSSHVTVGTSRAKLREQPIPSLTLTRGATGSGGVLPGEVFPGGTPALIGFPAETGIDSSEYAVDGRYVWPATGWYAGARASRSDAYMSPEVPFAQATLDHESAGVFAGRYFGPRTTLELDLESDTFSQETRTTPFGGIDPFGVPGVPGVPGIPVQPGIPELISFDLQTRSDTETQSARLSVRHVGQLGATTFALSASVRSSREETRVFFPGLPSIFTGVDPFNPPDRGVVAIGPDFLSFELMEILETGRERQVTLSGALFPTPALGVRLTFSTADRDTYGTSDRVGLSANWFFLRNAAIAVELTREDSVGRFPGGLPDADSVGVRLLGRF